MHSFVSRYSQSAADPLNLSLARATRVEEGEDDCLDDALWGSQAGFGNIASRGGPSFTVPSLPNVSSGALISTTLSRSRILPYSQRRSCAYTPMTTPTRTARSRSSTVPRHLHSASKAELLSPSTLARLRAPTSVSISTRRGLNGRAC